MVCKHLWSIRLNFLISVFSASSVVKYLIFSKLQVKNQLCNKTNCLFCVFSAPLQLLALGGHIYSNNLGKSELYLTPC